MENSKTTEPLKLINKVLATRTKVRLGEPYKIVVKTNPQIKETIHVSINGVLGKEQILQFSGIPRLRKILITASTDSKLFDFKIIEVEVLEGSECNSIPLINVGNYYEQENSISLKIQNEQNYKNCFFEWDFGKSLNEESIKIYSEQPDTIFCYENYLDNSKVYQTFHLKLTVHNRNTESKIIAEKSFTIHNLYAIEKKRGILKPRIKYDFQLFHDEKLLQGSCNITNLEGESLIIQQRQIEFLYNDPEKLSTPSKPEHIHDLIIEPFQTRNIDCSIPFKTYPKDSFGYAVHFKGVTRSGYSVFASAYFEFQTNYKNSIKIRDKYILSALNEFKNSTCKINKEIISLHDLQKYIQNKKELKQNFSLSSIITALNKQNANVPTMNIMSHGLNNSFGNLRLGEECIPDEEPPSEDFVCQLTEEWDWIFIPAKIINARKGDTILSPSGNGNIGGLLKQVSPPQLYSHSGLMIQNFYKLRHSTGSEDWLSDAAVGSFIDGSQGSDGIDPEKLKYFWPGTIDQTIEEAFNGSDFEDPDKLKDDKGNIKKYRIQAFDNYPKLNGNSEIIYPVVVKPEPAIEAENPKIREILHKVAEEGKKIKGHYRFYCYSEANISLQGFSDTYLAPDKGSNWWASKTLPTVCSSFIWAAIKAVPEINLHLEGKDFFAKPSDIETTDIGAEVDFKTIDGLYYYSESERLAAALWLYQNFYDIIWNKMDEEMGKVFIPIFNFFSDAADDLANQVCNTFGFDWSGEDESGNHSKDSDKWKNPGDGRAVSPHNIKSYWDAPKFENDKLFGLYGYSENLIYRPARIEWRKISKWVKVEKKIKVKGYVKFRGQSIANAVVKASGTDFMSNSNGYFEFETKISTNGNLLVEAGKFIDGLYMEGGIELNLNSYSGSDITIELKEPPAIYREVVIRGTMKLKDEENWPDSDEFETRSKLFGTIRLDDRAKHAETYWEERMGGEIRVEVRLKLDWKTDLSVSVWCNVKLYEGTSESTSDLDGEKTETHNILKDSTKEIKVFVRNDDENDDDHVDLSLIIANNVQP